MADTLVLGTSDFSRGSSSLPTPTICVQFYAKGRDVDRVACAEYDSDEFDALAYELGLSFGAKVYWRVCKDHK